MFLEHERSIPHTDNLMHGFERKQGLSYDAALELSEFAYQEFSNTPEIQHLPAVLNSMRRVMKIYFPSRFASDQGRTNPENSFRKINDIQYDLSSYAQVDLSNDSVLGLLKLLPKFEFASSSMVDVKVRNTRKQFSDVSVDEIRQLAEECLRTSLWWLWKPEVSTPYAFTYSLRKALLGNLGFLPAQILKSLNKGPLDFESWGGGDADSSWEEYFDARSIVDSDPSGNSPISDKMHEWYSFLKGNDVPLSTLFYFIDKMSRGEKISLLTRFDYISPGVSILETLVQRGLSLSSYSSRLLKGMSGLQQQLTQHDLSVPLFPDRSIKEVVEFTENNLPFSVGEALLPEDSPRIKLFSVRDSHEFLSKLNAAQVEVLKLLTEAQGSTFLYTLEQISDLSGYGLPYVAILQTRLGEIFEGIRPQFLTRDGVVLRDNTIQHNFLVMKNSGFPIESLPLNAAEKSYWDAMTTPDEQGRFEPKSLVTARLKIHDRVIRRMFAKASSAFKQYIDENPALQ